MRIYDFVMTHKLDSDDFFIHHVQRRCAERGLNFFLVEPLWVDAFYEKMQKGRVWARVLLNMNSEHHLPEEIYHRLVRLAFELKTRVIDPPDVALAAFYKAGLHPRLEGVGFTLPFTIVVPAGKVAGFTLTSEQRTHLGSPFVIKPALGYGKRGVLLDAKNESDLLRSAAAWPDQNYLAAHRRGARVLPGVFCLRFGMVLLVELLHGSLFHPDSGRDGNPPPSSLAGDRLQAG